MLSESNQTAYLCGPMEYDTDEGLGWRLEYRQDLAQLGIKCIIPNEEEKLIKDEKDMQLLKQQDLHEYIRIMRAFIKQDLSFTLNATYLICRWEGQRMSGTVGEAQARYLAGKDAYLVTSKPLIEVPGWFLACFTHYFRDKSSLLSYLREIAKA
jgi:hypothetical protein